MGSWRVFQPDIDGVLHSVSWWSGSSGLQHVRFWGDSLNGGKMVCGSPWSSNCFLCTFHNPEAQESLSHCLCFQP